MDNDSFKITVGNDNEFFNKGSYSLIWLPEYGMGYFPVDKYSWDPVYGEDYFKKYEGYAETEFGVKLNHARLDWVSRFYSGPLVDIGIGCGQFVGSRPDTFGFDVNPKGIQWLQDRSLFVDPRAVGMEAVSFWDSLEHIKDPRNILRNVKQWVFVSLPIFKSGEHVLKSKHFRKDEHCWYWTEDGFIAWMKSQGFIFQNHSLMESDLGREDIHTFAFKKM